MKEDLLNYRPTQNKNNEIESVCENGKITIIYPKKFGRIEQWVKDRIGGPDQVRRPLDKFTTFIWENCNGENNIAEIISNFVSSISDKSNFDSVKIQGCNYFYKNHKEKIRY